MRKVLLGAVLLLAAAPVFAQSGGMGGMGDMGGGMGGGPGGAGGPPGGGGGPARPKPMKPIKREEIAKVVTAMFQEADSNRDGIVTVAEVTAIVDQRRDAAVRDRFAAIDTDRNGSISLAEFQTWQRAMGSLASSDAAAADTSGLAVVNGIMPKLGKDAEDRVLSRLIEPINGMTIAQANTNYDAGASLEELLALEYKRFDAADLDHDGFLSEDEARRLDGGPRGRPGGPGGPPPGGGGKPPACPPGESC
ncbi:calcium-binding protein [Novosphingobium sp. KA1]|nr:EF-hand domain-containing protein [Novosphingobium sp. KA1]QSR19865.1 calcium-binding protein [Novosphingobium sp. KA1]